MHHIINSYLRKLTNLTSRNRSIYLPKLLAQGFVDVNDLDFLNNEPAFSIIEQLIARKKELFLCKVLDSRDEQNNKVSQKLKALWRFDKFVFEERGAKDLYLGWPFACGRFADGSLVRAPLLFFPVELDATEKAWVLRPRTDEFCYLNSSFLLAFAHFNGVPVNETLMEYNFEEFPTESRPFRVALYNLLKDHNLELNFNQENFTDNLLPFRNFNKASFEENHKQGAIKLFPEATLGLFPQAGSYLVPDYLQLLKDQEIPDVESFFGTPAAEAEEAIPNYLNRIKEEQTITPFKMDAFQENALKATKSGKSMVVQGPPGTGKSQLICNLMADYAAQGKKVLLVCQKRAALDVVYQRLSTLGMHHFAALVHDFKNDRRTLYEKILYQIENLDDYKKQNHSLDAIQLERQFVQVSRRIDTLTEEFEELKEALFDENECGLSIKELYLSSDFSQNGVNLKQEYKHFTWPQADEFVKILSRYHRYWSRLETDEFLWKNRRSFKQYSIDDLQSMLALLEEVRDYAEDMVQQASALLNIEVSFDDCEAFINNKEEILKFINLLNDEAVFDCFRHLVPFKDIEKDDLWLANMERVVMDCFKNEGPEVSIEAQELGLFQEILQKKIDSSKNIFKWLNWKLFSREKMQFQRVLRSNGLPNNKEGFKILVDKVDNRLNLQHNLAKLNNYTWLKDIPTNNNQVDLQAWFYYQKRALKAKMIFRHQRNFKEYFNIAQLSYSELKQKLEALIKLLDQLPARKTKWLNYLLPVQISHLVNHPEGVQKYAAELQSEFENLCAYDILQDELDSSQQDVISKLYDHWGQLEEEQRGSDPGGLFLNSLRLAWINHIETKYPRLRVVSSLELDEQQKEYQELVKQKRQISQDILLLKLREKIYSNVKYNRLNNMISYRDLRHQVSKKKRIWPIRKLLSQFDEELFKLVPCWLASPESVSAISPMRQLFDLVIFDEASQCFAEKGIPAMYRGKQVVVTGDSQQLSPNDLYQIRWQEEQVDDPDLEIDSLLDLAAKYLEQVQLRGHYRSRSLDLISFSNQHFYGGKLRMLPDFKEANQSEAAIEYIKVEGSWERNINQNEAIEVALLVERLIKEYPDQSIGVVTFNVQQQQYITERIEDRLAASEIAWPSSLIVKNIENVQGDEKDFIIFSVGYAPDKDGKFTMNFGSLNATGGANRLNVAITRARNKVIVVASIMPADLRVSNTKNEGPKLFKQYLQHAWDVAKGNHLPVQPSLEEFPASWYLKSRLKTELNARTDLGFDFSLPFADLTLTKSGAYLGLVLTDDDLYFQSISVKDSHVYIPLILYEKGWRFQGVFSRQYWMNEQEVLEQLARFGTKEHAAKNQP